MLHAVETKPIVSERTPEACDFADRLQLLAGDVKVVELAIEGLQEHYNGPGEDTAAIVMACRRLYGDLVMMSEEVLPPISKAERERIEAAVGRPLRCLR